MSVANCQIGLNAVVRHGQKTDAGLTGRSVAGHPTPAVEPDLDDVVVGEADLSWFGSYECSLRRVLRLNRARAMGAETLQKPSISTPSETDPGFVGVFHTLNQRHAHLFH